MFLYFFLTLVLNKAAFISHLLQKYSKKSKILLLFNTTASMWKCVKMQFISVIKAVF